MPPGDFSIWARGGGFLSRLFGLEGNANRGPAAGGISSTVSDAGEVSGSAIRAIDVIRQKRDGHELSRAEIDYLVRGYTSGEIPDYQISAWLMAALLKGLN